MPKTDRPLFPEATKPPTWYPWGRSMSLAAGWLVPNQKTPLTSLAARILFHRQHRDVPTLQVQLRAEAGHRTFRRNAVRERKHLRIQRRKVVFQWPLTPEM